MTPKFRAWIEAAPRRWIGLAAGLGAGVYVAASSLGLASRREPIRIGLPLDDGWIFQVFARSLAGAGAFTFNPGEPTSGATSIPWALLLAPGELLGAPLAWTLALGALSHAITAWMAYGLARDLSQSPRAALVASAIVVFDWHLAWIAPSGMETLLFAALCMGAMRLWVRRAHPVALGAALAAAAWVRPEGAVLAATLVAGACVLGRDAEPIATRLRRAVVMGVVLALALAPIAALNAHLGGSPLPQTLSAKRALYAPHFDPAMTIGYPLVAAAQILPGPLAVCAPLAAYAAARRLREKAYGVVPLMVWLVVIVIGYALLLPYPFHYGRYLMPFVPPTIVLGIEGLDRLRTTELRLLQTWLPRVLVAITAVTWIWGITLYRDATAHITSLHVRAALWVREHAAADALVATHDIGAIRYFSDRRVLDLAGLVTPEATAYLDDPAAMVRFIAARRATYAVLHTGWFPGLHRAFADREVARFRSLPGAPEQADLVIYDLAPPSPDHP